MPGISRRRLIAGGLAGITLSPQLALAETFAPSAASLVRPASPVVSATGLLIELATVAGEATWSDGATVDWVLGVAG